MPFTSEILRKISQFHTARMRRNSTGSEKRQSPEPEKVEGLARPARQLHAEFRQKIDQVFTENLPKKNPPLTQK